MAGSGSKRLFKAKRTGAWIAFEAFVSRIAFVPRNDEVRKEAKRAKRMLLRSSFTVLLRGQVAMTTLRALLLCGLCVNYNLNRKPYSKKSPIYMTGLKSQELKDLN